jgi:predicted HTH domain antitoxin
LPPLKLRYSWSQGTNSLRHDYTAGDPSSQKKASKRYDETEQQDALTDVSPPQTNPLALAVSGVLRYNGATGRKERKMDKVSTVDWEIEQLVKARLFPDQQAVVRSALRALFQAQPGIRQQMIVSAYTAGDISLGKAAELMGVSHEELKDILVESGVEVHLGPQTAEELLQDAANA